MNKKPKSLYQEIQTIKNSIQKRQLIANGKQTSVSSMSSILLKQFKKNPSQIIRQVIKQTQVTSQALFSLALNIKSLSLIPRLQQIADCQRCVNWASAIVKQNKFNDIIITKIFTIGRILNEKYLFNLKVHRDKKQNIYETNRREYIRIVNKILQHVTQIHGNQIQFQQNLIWLMEQKMQYIQKLANQLFISLTATNGRKFVGYCISHNIFEPLLQKIYQLQIQLQTITLQVIQQNFKIALTRIVLKHQIFYIKCVIMSYMKGLVLIGNQMYGMYNQIRESEMLTISSQNQYGFQIQTEDLGLLTRDLFQQYDKIEAVLQKSINQNKQKFLKQIKYFLKISGDTSYSIQLIQIQKEVVNFFNQQYKLFPPQIPLTKAATKVQTVVNYIANTAQSLIATVNQKDNHLGQLKNKLIAENMKKYIENVGITIKKAQSQIIQIMQKKKILYKSKRQNELRMNTIRSYVQGILINVVNPITTAKQQPKLKYLQLINKNMFLNGRKPSLDQQYGIIYLSHIQGVNNIIKDFCKVYDINIREVVLSDFFNSIQTDQFKQIQLLYQQTQIYLKLNNRFSQHTVRYDKNKIINSSPKQYSQYQTPSAFTILQTLLQSSSQLTKHFNQHANQIFYIVHKVQSLKAPQPLRSTIMAKQILAYLVPIVSTNGKTIVDQDRYLKYTQQIIKIYKNQKVTKRVETNFLPMTQNGYQNNDYWKYNSVKFTNNQENQIQVQINNIQQKFKFLSSMQDEQKFTKYRQLARKLQIIKKIQNINQKAQYLQKQILKLNVIHSQYQIPQLQKKKKNYQNLLRKREQLYSQAQIKSIQQLKQTNKTLINEVKSYKQKQKQNEKIKSDLTNQINELKFQLRKQQQKQKYRKQQIMQQRNQIANKIQNSMEKQFSQQQINQVLDNLRNKYNIFPIQTVQFILKSGYNFDESISNFFKILKFQQKQQIQTFINDHISKIRLRNMAFPIQVKKDEDIIINSELMKQLLQYITKTIKKTRVYPQYVRLKRKQLILQLQLHNLKMKLQTQQTAQQKMRIISYMERINQQIKKIHALNKKIFDAIEELIRNIKYNWKVKGVQPAPEQNDVFRIKVANYLIQNFKNNSRMGQNVNNVKAIQSKFIVNLQNINKQIQNYQDSQIYKQIYVKLQTVPQILSDIVSGKQDERNLVSLLQAAHRLHQNSMKQFEKVNKMHVNEIQLIKCLTQKYYEKSIGVMKTLYLMQMFQTIIQTNENPQLSQIFDNLKKFVMYPENQIFNYNNDGITQCYESYPIYVGIQRLNKMIKKTLSQEKINTYMKAKVTKLKTQLQDKVESFKKMTQNILRIE